MGHPADLSRGVLLLSDGRLGSYAVIGDLFRQTFSRAGVRVEQQPLDEDVPGRCKSREIAGARVVVHNTIGPRLEPLPGAVNVALVHHEWDRYPRPWVERLNAFHAVWATSAFARRTLRRSGVRVPVLLRLPALGLEAVPRKRGYARQGPRSMIPIRSQISRASSM